MPRDPPVTKATLPSSEKRSCRFSDAIANAFLLISASFLRMMFEDACRLGPALSRFSWLLDGQLVPGAILAEARLEHVGAPLRADGQAAADDRGRAPGQALPEDVCWSGQGTPTLDPLLGTARTAPPRTRCGAIAVRSAPRWLPKGRGSRARSHRVARQAERCVAASRSQCKQGRSAC